MSQSEDSNRIHHKETVTSSKPDETIRNDVENSNVELTDKLNLRKNKKRKSPDIYTLLLVFCTISFVIFAGLFINAVFIQPMLADKSVDYTRKLYKEPSITPASAVTGTPAITVNPLPATDRDTQGRLTMFKELLSKNKDTKGWISYPGTNIDYVVMQNKNDPIYYLSHNFNKEMQKAGCLFLDHKSCVESNTKNLVIHGHNMKSSDNMFHYLEHMKKLDYFKTRTSFTFNTIYQTGQWKVFSVFITNGSDKKEPFFDYTQSSFSDSSEFMNFIYQLRIRSIYNLDQVDINENDQICTLSTCTYEIDNYRLVIVARKVREGENGILDKDKISYSTNPLYPQSFYNNYGGKAPKWPKFFEQALNKGLIRWYKIAKSPK